MIGLEKIDRSNGVLTGDAIEAQNPAGFVGSYR
jgi:hypothetical protein